MGQPFLASLMLTFTLITLVLTQAHAQALPDQYSAFWKRTKSNGTHINYKRLKTLPQTIPGNATGELYKKYQPYFYVKSGCKPYPAIDTQGRLSGGLSPDNDASDKSICRQSKGQVYVRSGQYKKFFAIMYSFYMPRDATWTETIKEGAGHRYDWENAVVWLTNDTDKSKVVAVSPSAHGGYKMYYANDFNFKKKTHPLIAYGQPWDGVRNHQLLKADDDEVGQKQNMVAWESMTDTMRAAIEMPGSFDGCTPGIRDSEWEGFLKNAYPGNDAVSQNANS